MTEEASRSIQRQSGAFAEAAAESRQNQTGLPDTLKAGVENLSGYSLDDVRVHYNSGKPAQFQALAYTQDTDIHVAPGQEEHLPHEAWHVVQQAQGRVQATMQMKGVAVNNDVGLEKEADIMGARAMQLRESHGSAEASEAHKTCDRSGGFSNSFYQRAPLSTKKADSGVKQFVVYNNEAALWAAVTPDIALPTIRGIINGNPELQAAYEDSLLNLNRMNFIDNPGTQPNAGVATNPDGTYNITYGQRHTQEGIFSEEEIFIGAIIHEMGHVNSGLQYATNVPPGEQLHNANMHLPVAGGAFFPGTQVGLNQFNDPVSGVDVQFATMANNWQQLVNLRTTDHGFTADEIGILDNREQYAQGVAQASHYDTVLVDILYFLQHRGLTETHYYLQATAMLQEANTRRRAGHGVVQAVPLVPAPVNQFLNLYNAVSNKLLEARWNNEGQAFIGTKVPAGVAEMRTQLDNSAKRESLNAIYQNALHRIAHPDRQRSHATTNLYNALAQINLRSNFVGLIGTIQGI
jgi:hypothetical protein